MFFKQLQKQGLITQYYRCPQFMICRVADYAIMAIWLRGIVNYDDDGNVASYDYIAWELDRELGNKIIKNNNLLAATMLSNQLKRDPDMLINTITAVQILTQIQNEVKSGTRQSKIDPVFEKELKAIHKEELKPYIDRYGNPPVFSKRKFWAVMLAFFLYPLGLPWFVSGNTKKGLITLAVMIAGGFCSTFFLPMVFVIMVPMVINVFVFYYRLIAGKIKDEKGLYVLTKARQKEITDLIERYNAYAKELGE